MYVGRLVGLIWTVLLVSKVGIGGYGKYAMAFAASGIVVSLLDNPFLIRSMRVSPSLFFEERRRRMAIAVALSAVASVAFLLNYVIGYALIIAAGEISVTSIKSGRLRNGHIDKVMVLDLVRQVASVLIATSYLITSEAPSVIVASLLYAAPYLAAMVFGVFRFGLAVPLFPGGVRTSVTLSLSALAGAGYAQGDVVLLGALAGNAVAGVYSIASIVAWAAAGVFQNYANAHIAEAREHSGLPTLWRTGGAAVGVSILVALTALACIGLGLLAPLGQTLLALTPFVALRGVNHVCTVGLIMRGRDSLRMVATICAAALDLTLVALLVRLGSLGASIAASVSELVLFAIFVRGYGRLENDWSPIGNHEETVA